MPNLLPNLRRACRTAGHHLSFPVLLLALLAPPGPRAEHNRREVQPGTTEWHYGSDNTVMEEGHRRIRAWRVELEAQRRRALEEMQGPKPAAKVSAAADVLPAPPLPGTEYTFAEGMIRGKWQANRITHNSSGSGYGSGVRLDRTVYDPDLNTIYALTTEKNLVEAPLTQLGSWTQRNQVVLIEKLGFTGVKTAGGKFRLIGSINGVFRYSDDAGMTWTSATGGNHDLGAVYFTQALGNGHILAHVRKTVGSEVADVIQRSIDFGATFQDLRSWPVAQSAGIVSTWLYNTTDHCLVVRNPPDGGGWDIYQYKDGAFSRLATATATGTPVTITGTFHEGVKVYVSTTTEGGYYSEGGTNWVRRATLKPRLESVHPTRPELLFANEAQHDISTDGGLTWRTYPDNDRTVGWDPKHLTYHKVGGKWVFVVANDMGLCFNPEPLDTAAGAWRYVNDNHTFAILHGGVSVDHTGLTVTGNQDPGTHELTRTGRGSYSAQSKNGADGLRAAASNDGKAYWYKHYWDTFMHNHAAATGDTRKAAFDIPNTKWYTPPFKGSTTPGEDAIYVSGQAKLVKLTYVTANNTVTRLDLPYDFQASAGEVTFGVGVAKSDPSRLYVATRNGRFFYSRDAGATWTETSYTGPKPAPSSYPVWNQSAGLYIEVADTDPNLVYWGASGNAVTCLISRDGGRTFQAAQNGLPADARIGALSLSPDGKLAFSSTFHVYIASKNAWYDLRAASMPSGALPAAMGLNYLPLQRKVRYFTWGSGVLDLDITHLSTPDHPAAALPPSTSTCYQMAEAGTGLVLGTNSAGGLDLAAASGASRIRWQFQGVDGFHRATAAGTQKVLDVSGVSYAEGGAVGLWDWNTDDNQLWHLVRGPDSLWSLFARHSVKALEANSGQVRQTTWSGAKAQKWRITAAANCQNTTPIAAANPSKVVELRRLGGGRFRIVHVDERAFHVLVYDAAGVRVREAKATGVIDLAGLPLGIYHAKIMSDHVFVMETLAHTAP